MLIKGNRMDTLDTEGKKNGSGAVDEDEDI
jgi:hypothetical protein